MKPYNGHFNLTKQFIQKLIAFLFLMQYISAQVKPSSIKPHVVNLRTEYKTDPLGIDMQKPRLSWEIVSSGRSVYQKAYYIRASFSKDDLLAGKKLCWNSGRIISDRSVHIEYAGNGIESCRRIYWQVKIWDNQENESDWSEPAFFEFVFLYPSYGFW